MSETNNCPLCNRELAEPIVRHHLIPPSKGGRDTATVAMHKICQAKVHAVFTETEQKNYYNTVDRLREHEEIARFIKWVSKKEPEFFDNTINKRK
ncbi:MAG: HNH endonuclease [Ferruginibacter sp.]